MRKQWGGVFTGTNDRVVEAFGQSIDTDLTFWQEDVIASVAHVRMLAATGIIPAEDAKAIEDGLEKIHEQGPAALPKDVEDIHTAVEVRLYELIGDVAGKLHTARSRNDQVATDSRLYVHNALLEVLDDLKRLQATILEHAKRHAGDLMPGYTHGQRAQPITLGFHLLAYFWALQRHGWRFERVMEVANYCPLGAAALAGTGFPIDRFATSKELGFTAPMPNALDAVSDRSYMLDALSSAASLMIDLSRISHELVLFSGREFGFVKLGDAVTTGSSIMPQKRNPDMAELIRGRAGRAIANWVSLATTMKGLQLGYNRDAQDDKPPLFSSLRLVNDSLLLVGLMLDNATWQTEHMRSAMHGDFSTATDLADALARTGMPFRQAHEVVGGVVKSCLDKGIPLEALDAAGLAEVAPKAPPDTVDVLRPEGSVASRESYGGPGPKAMARQLEEAAGALAAPGFPRPV